jgi:hypothetical protein
VIRRRVVFLSISTVTNFLADLAITVHFKVRTQTVKELSHIKQTSFSTYFVSSNTHIMFTSIDISSSMLPASLTSRESRPIWPRSTFKLSISIQEEVGAIFNDGTVRTSKNGPPRHHLSVHRMTEFQKMYDYTTIFCYHLSTTKTRKSVIWFSNAQGARYRSKSINFELYMVMTIKFSI